MRICDRCQSTHGIQTYMISGGLHGAEDSIGYGFDLCSFCWDGLQIYFYGIMLGFTKKDEFYEKNIDKEV